MAKGRRKVNEDDRHTSNPTPRKTCSACGRNLIVTHNYYSSYSKWHKHDGRVPICKACLKSHVDETDIATVIEVLRLIDKPYIHDMWMDSVRAKKETMGHYLSKLSMTQYLDLRFKDSKYEDGSGEISSDTRNSKKGNSSSLNDNDSIDILQVDEIKTEHGVIKVDEDLRLKWGNYSNRELIEMEKLYLDMYYANDVSTPQHKLQLKAYCKTAILMGIALEEGDMSKYKELSSSFDKLDKSTGFRPIDRKDSSSSSGIRSFSQIYEEIERDGFIKPADYTESQDIVDKTIQYMINYQLKLMNSTQLSKPPEDTPKIESLESGDEDGKK